MNNQIIPFSYDSTVVRVIKDDSNNPWWVAKDVCDILGYSNSRKAINDHLDDDEKGVTDCYTRGGIQEMVTISESGLYALIIRSNKPEAKKFRKWVTGEVLPQIRKTGSYQYATTTSSLTPAQQRQAQKLIADRVYSSGVQSQMVGVAFRQIYKQIKDAFHVGVYRDIPSDMFDELVKFIKCCHVDTPKAIESPSHVDENALALRVADAVMKQVQPQVIRYEKTSDIVDLIVNMQKDIKDMAIQVKHELVRELKPVATITHCDGIPMPREQWQRSWDTLCMTHADLSRAVEQFRKDVTDLIPTPSPLTIPKGADVLEHIRLHYSAMEKAARQINVLSELLMWRSPKVMNGNMELAKPRY